MNDNYSDFLSLGTSLAGGEERIEEVSVGLLGFERDVQQLREKVEQERDRVARLIREKRDVMREIGVGRALLEIEERIEELEFELGLSESVVAKASTDDVDEEENEGKEKAEWSEEWNDDVPIESDEEYEEGEKSAVPSRLRKRAEQFLMVLVLVGRFNSQHPFLVAEQVRIRKIRETLLLDLDAAIRAEPEVKGKQDIMRLRSSVEE